MQTDDQVETLLRDSHRHPALGAVLLIGGCFLLVGITVYLYAVSPERAEQAIRSAVSPNATLPPFHPSIQPTALARVTVQGASESGLLSINEASQEELETLPQIGAVRAERIIKSRPYKDIEELQQKTQLPSSVIKKLTPYVRF